MADKEQLSERAKDQLDRVLSFFPRVDAVSSVVLGVNVGMIAILSNSLILGAVFNWRMIFVAAAFILIGLSLVHLYLGSFPRLDGGWRSLIYFREIAQRGEAEFIKAFLDQSDEDYVNDLLSQVWRNSEILTLKFDQLKRAFILLALAVIPWTIALVLSPTRSAETPVKVTNESPTR
jgi:hypothetical protein